MTAKRGLVVLFIADVLSAVGSRITMVAIPWLVLVTTGSAARMGLVAAVELVPYIVVSIMAGPVIDRLGPRRTAILANLTSAIAVAAIAGTATIGFAVLLVLVALAGGLRGAADRSKDLLFRPMAEAAEVKLIRVTSLHETCARGATLLGAPLGGLLIYWTDASSVLWIDAVTFLVCGLLIAGFVRPPEVVSAASPDKYFRSLAVGFSYVRRDALLATMLITTFTVNIFASASTAVFIPVWVADELGSPAGLGLTLGAFAGGALLGSIAFTVWATKLPRYLTFALGAFIGGSPRLLVLGLSDNLVLVAVITFLSGIGIAAINPVFGAVLYEHVPKELQARVIGLVAATSFAGLPLGALLAGELVSGMGLFPALITSGIVCLIVSVYPLLRRGPGRILDAPTPAEAV
ncbi:MFS transporter [Kribbella antibiotica]|uniref:Multidrug efflux pump Tap n=1 Tax=Kribbella antibiotica TaxID=190195 RepID=A0A4R4ZGT2_9ACTN|nr:MFS transporter [Kribbella antibiotica]TDD57615.1 MFS transporter [Kribbella antibiotica]